MGATARSAARRAAWALCAAAALLALASTPAAARTFIRDAEIEATLARMAAPILRAAGLGEDDVRFFIIRDPSVNAFVAGGPNVFLHTGLLSRFENPAAVMGVVAHEIGHITGGHLARRAIAARELSGPTLIATVLGAVAAAAAGSPSAGAAIAIGGQSAARGRFFSYTQGEEAAADQAAMTYLDRAGVDPSGMLDVLRMFRGQEVFARDRTTGYARTHPLSAARLTFLERRVQASSAYGRPLDPEILYRHARMRAKLDGFLNDPARTLNQLEAAADPDSEANQLRRAVAEFRLARVDAALATVARLKARRPRDAYYQELEGQILFESARVPQAVEAYRRAAALAPDEPLIAGRLGRALLATGDPRDEAEALALLRRTARDDPGEAGVLRDLAQAYARAGEDGMAALTTAQRIALSGDAEGAARLARRAMALLPEGSPGWLQADDIAALAAPIE